VNRLPAWIRSTVHVDHKFLKVKGSLSLFDCI
jgi:hypothetical protein